MSCTRASAPTPHYLEVISENLEELKTEYSSRSDLSMFSESVLTSFFPHREVLMPVRVLSRSADMTVSNVAAQSGIFPPASPLTSPFESQRGSPIFPRDMLTPPHGPMTPSYSPAPSDISSMHLTPSPNYPTPPAMDSMNPTSPFYSPVPPAYTAPPSYNLLQPAMAHSEPPFMAPMNAMLPYGLIPPFMPLMNTTPRLCMPVPDIEPERLVWMAGSFKESIIKVDPRTEFRALYDVFMRFPWITDVNYYQSEFNLYQAGTCQMLDAKIKELNVPVLFIVDSNQNMIISIKYYCKLDGSVLSSPSAHPPENEEVIEYLLCVRGGLVLCGNSQNKILNKNSFQEFCNDVNSLLCGNELHREIWGECLLGDRVSMFP